MKRVTIGDNCIIGAGSVVTKSIPANSVACGVPAKVICSIEDYVRKNEQFFEKTTDLTAYEKRLHVMEHMEKYEAQRREKESGV